MEKQQLNNHGRDFYEEIGRKGGEATAENHDRDFYEKIGKKGGEATAENHDSDFYEEIGQKGGEARARQNDDDNGNNRNGKMSRSKAGRKGGKRSQDND